MIRVLTVFAILVATRLHFASAYRCYDCNSTYDRNCFDLASDKTYFKASYCEERDGTAGKENCVAIELQEFSSHKMYRFCGKVGTCESYEKNANDHLKVLNCRECDKEYCNQSVNIQSTLFLLMLPLLLMMILV